ncbi:MAG: hypothetical protein OER86_09090 [Phycisphaerae bacterium]|nr:hypothetical protein [Phycisphaerae bacterium]
MAPYIYAGIDEAGYGPMFGPFVLSRCVFSIEGPTGGEEPPSLWELLESAVCRRNRDRRRRIAIDDSKKLYTPASGLAGLERGVLAFLRTLDHTTASVDRFLETVAHDDDSRVPERLWYHDQDGGPELPLCHTDDQVRVAASMLGRAAEAAAVRLVDLRSAIVYEDRFNRLIESTRSKGRCAWTFVAQHLWSIWETYGKLHPWVVVDRQGGRKVYHRLLQMIFAEADLQLLDESDDISRYRIRDASEGRSITISFETASDARHLPVALASMLAKYARELLMHRFNAFWKRQDPDLSPTAGYVQDGRRFLAEIEPVIERLGIDRRHLIRSR